MKPVDYDTVADRYQAGRGPIVDLDTWHAVLEPHLPAPPVRVIDMGAGTGIFSRAWPAWGAAVTVAVEPSSAMLAESVRVGIPDSAVAVCATGEAIPLTSGAANVAWLSAVVHHLTDGRSTAAQLHRVLQPHGAVLVRGFFPDASTLPWLDHFPGRDRATAQFPTVAEVTSDFESEGFHLRGVIDVAEPAGSAEAIARWCEQMCDVDTILAALAETEVATGIASLHQVGHEVMTATLNLLVLTRDD